MQGSEVFDISSMYVFVGPPKDDNKLLKMTLYALFRFYFLQSCYWIPCQLFRSLYLGSVAEKRGRSIHITDLEELLGGCSELEVSKWIMWKCRYLTIRLTIHLYYI